MNDEQGDKQKSSGMEGESRQKNGRKQKRKGGADKKREWKVEMQKDKGKYGTMENLNKDKEFPLN